MQQREVRHVAVIGTGTIGASWAAFFLSRGLRVSASDPAPQAEPQLRQFVDAVWPPEVIVASSSSGLLISRLQAGCRHPERCVIGHPFNPPHLIPLVEVV